MKETKRKLFYFNVLVREKFFWEKNEIFSNVLEAGIKFQGSMLSQIQ